jgi:Ser/Thr protein kinase RdoA (MazF antagonist)
MRTTDGAGRTFRIAGAPARLGADLWALVARLDAPLVAARTLTRLPSPVMAHASFRLRLANGRTVKGRRVETPAQAHRIAELLPRLDARHFPRVLARRGRALLEAWVPGTALARLTAGELVYRRCGRILGSIHVAPRPGRMATAPASAARRLAVAERQLAELESLGALSVASSRQALCHLRDNVPDRAAVGVIHRDFCAENIVCTPAGSLYVVDNETIRVDIPEFDLARTWYRWPMTPPQCAAFLTGYRSRRDPSSFLRHFPFWAIAALVDTVLFRLRARTPGASLPVRRLHALLRELEQGRGALAPRTGPRLPA